MNGFKTHAVAPFRKLPSYAHPIGTDEQQASIWRRIAISQSQARQRTVPKLSLGVMGHAQLNKLWRLRIKLSNALLSHV